MGKARYAAEEYIFPNQCVKSFNLSTYLLLNEGQYTLANKVFKLKLLLQKFENLHFFSGNKTCFQPIGVELLIIHYLSCRLVFDTVWTPYISIILQVRCHYRKPYCIRLRFCKQWQKQTCF